MVICFMKDAMRLFFVLLVTAITVTFLSGCTKEPSGGSSQKLKVVAIFNTPVEEPWDGAIHNALTRAQKELDIQYEYTDKVDANQFEKTVQSYAEKGYDIIIGDAFSAEEVVRRVAAKYPNIVFVFGSGLGPSNPNFSVFDNWIHEPAYLAGMIAGKLTKTNVIGVVGGFPIPEVNRLINAYKAGAKEVNPNVKLKVAFIGSWYDPTKAREATNTLIAHQADVMYAERAGVIESCAEKKIPVFGNLLDQHRIDENVVVTSVLWDMWPTVKHIIERVRTKTYTAENYSEWSMMAKRGAYLAPFHSWEKKIDKSIVDMINKRTDEILSGRFRVPIIEDKPESD